MSKKGKHEFSVLGSSLPLCENHQLQSLVGCTGFRDEMSIKGERAAFTAARYVQRSGAVSGYWGARPSRTKAMGSECVAGQPPLAR